MGYPEWVTVTDKYSVLVCKGVKEHFQIGVSYLLITENLVLITVMGSVFPNSGPKTQ